MDDDASAGSTHRSRAVDVGWQASYRVFLAALRGLRKGWQKILLPLALLGAVVFALGCLGSVIWDGDARFPYMMTSGAILTQTWMASHPSTSAEGAGIWAKYWPQLFLLLGTGLIVLAAFVDDVPCSAGGITANNARHIALVLLSCSALSEARDTAHLGLLDEAVSGRSEHRIRRQHQLRRRRHLNPSSLRVVRCGCHGNDPSRPTAARRGPSGPPSLTHTLQQARCRICRKF